ncbi:MAG: NERD domain-containing protein [Dehalococcoidia bacterium]|nr:NERD domain-containing protein [Dehalococcoidia bacterium]
MFPERLPARLRDDRSRRAEVRVFDALAEAPAGWRVFHSVAWLSRDQTGDLRDGEADFVIVHPSYGLRVVEVKGGGIEVDGRSGQWWSIDAAGEQHAIHDPFAQAARSKHALVAKVRELPGFRDQWIPAAHWPSPTWAASTCRPARMHLWRSSSPATTCPACLPASTRSCATRTPR